MSEFRDDLKSMIGEGVHTGLRKAADSHASGRAWQAIRDMPVGEWDSVLDFVADGLMPWLGPQLQDRGR